MCVSVSLNRVWQGGPHVPIVVGGGGGLNTCFADTAQ